MTKPSIIDLKSSLSIGKCTPISSQFLIWAIENRDRPNACPGNIFTIRMPDWVRQCRNLVTEQIWLNM